MLVRSDKSHPIMNFCGFINVAVEMQLDLDSRVKHGLRVFIGIVTFITDIVLADWTVITFSSQRESSCITVTV